MLTMAITEYTDVEILLVLIYLPGDTIIIYVSRGREFEGISSVNGVESNKIVFLWGTSYSPV